MSRKFLITGLPRSRTAWLSLVASQVAGAICYHEPIVFCKTWQDSLAVWSLKGYTHLGISDSSLGFHLGEILPDYGPRTLIVERSIGAVVQSCLTADLPDPRHYCELLSSKIRPFRDHPMVKTVAFEALKSPHVVLDCLTHLMPGAEIDIKKIALAEYQNIQVDLAMIRGWAKDRAPDADAILGADVMRELCA